jgi:N-acetylmuramoyl-L-alanine amidase
MNSIAFDAGFFWRTLWDHPGNAELRRTRGNPMVLRKGDRVTIAEKEPRIETGATEQRHRFRRKGVPAIVSLRFLEEGEPRANVPCLITIDGLRTERSTNGDGVLVVPIPPNAREGHVELGKGEDRVIYQLDLGCLDPHGTVRGMQQRLGTSDSMGDGRWTTGPYSTLARFATCMSSTRATIRARDRIRDEHGS